MRFEVLGPLRVIACDGGDVAPRGEQQRRALTALVAAAPDRVSRGALEELLWDGAAPSGNALQALMSKLRKVVAPAAIEGDGRGYALTGEFECDLREFERMLAAGDYRGAEALVRGDPLDDIADHLSSAAERARLAGLVDLARRRRIESVVAGPTPLEAIAELEALVVGEPHDEGWWALLMRARQRSGMHADALRTFQRAREVLAEELGLLPGAELQAIEREILAGTPSGDAPPHAVRHANGLPARLSSFVGREHDLAALAAAIGSNRLVTLVGPGGTGKTTTALELARRSRPSEAVFVGLAPLSDVDAIVRAMARAIGLPDADQAPRVAQAPGEDPLDRVVAGLRATPTMLVVDNCEHVLDAIAPVVHRILEECESVRVIATSRASLAVPGEHVYPLPPLPAEEAIALFTARARDHAGVVSIEGTGRETLEMLCDRLDRLPLAIELAAARLRSMSIDELIDRLDDRFALLTSGPRTVAPRQQTLRAVVDWSHDLLDPAEQAVFRRMAVFVGGATSAAVDFVATGAPASSLPAGAALAAADRLLDKSLLRVERTPDGTRYSMLQTIQDYAGERLAASGEREHVLVRHAQYYADLLVGARDGLTGHDQARWMTLLGRERQNIDAARATAIARQDAQLALELTAPLGWYLYMTGELETGAEIFAEALACPGPTEPEIRALTLAHFSWLVANGTFVEHAVAHSSEAMALLSRVEDPWVRGLVVNFHVMALFFAGRIDMMGEMLPALEELVADSEQPWMAAVSKVVLGELCQATGDSAAAERLFLEAADLFDAVGDRFVYALTITEASEIAEMSGQYEQAAAFLERGIALADEVGFSGNPLALRARLANVEILRGNLDAAERHHRAVLDDGVASAVPWLHAMSLIGMSMLARRRGDFAEAERLLARAWDLPRSQSVPHMRSMVLVARGYLADQQGDFRRALGYQLEGVRTAASLRSGRAVAYSLEGCAGALAIEPGGAHAGLGAQLLGAADRMRRESGGPMPPAERFDVDRAERRLRDAIGEPAFTEAFRGGADADVNRLVAAVESLATTTA